jgi:hypothetical protein
LRSIKTVRLESSRRWYSPPPFLALLACALAALVAAGCGSTETVTVTEESEAPPPKTVTEEQPAASKPKKKKRPRPAAAPAQDLGGDVALVPNRVGQDHQLAQDTLQAAGFYLIDETDCSGQDRLLLWDRNWTVVEQEPPGGTEASVDDTITLCSVKDGE